MRDIAAIIGLVGRTSGVLIQCAIEIKGTERTLKVIDWPAVATRLGISVLGMSSTESQEAVNDSVAAHPETFGPERFVALLVDTPGVPNNKLSTDQLIVVRWHRAALKSRQRPDDIGT